MKVAIFETGHHISNTVCRTVADVCGFDLYDWNRHCPNLTRYDCVLGYGILRNMRELYQSHPCWFEIDKSFWDAGHFDGLYRISFRSTSPIYEINTAKELQKTNHGQVLQPWRNTGYTLICPPTEHVCEFFGVDQGAWINEAVYLDDSEWCVVRHKDNPEPIDWDNIGKLVTFNSSLGFEALKRGIPVISDPDHSTIGSFQKNAIDPTNRDELFSFASGHMKKLTDREGIWAIVNQYMSGGIPVKPLPRTSYATRFSAELPAEWT